MNFKMITIIAVIVHVICAIFSSGFHHFDEHFQIYEFLNLKLGGSSEKDLAWEFHDKVRPWIQVYIYKFILDFFSFFGISSPFTFAFLFRLFTSLLGVFSAFTLIPCLKTWFKSQRSQIRCYLLLNFCFFVPYIHTRTNAESMSSSFFIIGLSLLLSNLKEEKILKISLAGLALGLSYSIRYQLAVMIAPLWFWLLIFHYKKIKTLSVSAIMILFMIALGVIVDFYGYGVWTFTPYNLYLGNFVEDRLSSFGVDPFWYYLKLSFMRGFPPVSLPLILAFFWTIIKLPKHPLVWSTLPFFIFHSIIGHKELRFIFPVILLSPIFLNIMLEQYEEKLIKNKIWSKCKSTFIFFNIILLIIVCFKTANPSVKFYNFVYQHTSINEIYYEGESPYSMVGLPIKYYAKDGLKLIKLKNILKFKENPGGYYFLRSGDKIKKFENNENCKNIFMTYPRWTLGFNIGGWVERSRIWALYNCTKF